MSKVGSVVDFKTARQAIDDLIGQAKLAEPHPVVLNLYLQALWQALGERGKVPQDYADSVWAHIKGKIDAISANPVESNKAAVTAMFKSAREGALDKAQEIKSLRLQKLQPGGAR